MMCEWKFQFFQNTTIQLICLRILGEFLSQFLCDVIDRQIYPKLPVINVEMETANVFFITKSNTVRAYLQ